MILYSAAATGGVLTLGSAVASTLFLSTKQADETPLLILWSGLAAALAFILHSLLASRVDLTRLVLISNGVLVTVTLLLRALLQTRLRQSEIVLLGVFLVADAGAMLLLSQFWMHATQVFDKRAARRLIWLPTLGGSLGGIASGLFLAAGAGRFLGVENLVLLMALAIGLCMLCAFALRTNGTTPSSPGLLATSTLRKDLRAMIRSPLLRLLGLLTVLTALLVNLTNYQWFMALQDAFGGEGVAMVTFQGRYEALVGIAAIAAQLWLTRRLLPACGARVGLLLFPIYTALLGLLVWWSAGALLATTLLRAGDPVLRATIHVAAMAVLYLPLAEGLRHRARGILEILYALSVAALGAVLLLVQGFKSWTWVHQVWPLVGIAAAFLAGIGLFWWHYRAALHANLLGRRLQGEDPLLDLCERSVRDELQAALQSQDERLVLHALDLLATDDSPTQRSLVRPLLRHPSPELRAQAILHLGATGLDPGLEEELAAMLCDPAAQVQAELIVLLHRQGRADSIKAASNQLQELLASANPSRRAVGARLLGLLQPPTTIELLRALVADRGEVGEAAIRSAGLARAWPLMPQMLHALQESGTARAAMDALVSYGPGVEDLLLPLIESSETEDLLRERLVRVLARLRTARAARILADGLPRASENLRSSILWALVELGARGLPPVISPEEAEVRMRAEALEASRWALLRKDLGDHAGVLLSEALERRQREASARALAALALSRRDTRLNGLRDPLLSSHEPRREAAMEWLDELTTPALRALLLPLLEGSLGEAARLALHEEHDQHKDQRREQELARRSPQNRLRELSLSSDDWISACARARMQDTGSEGPGSPTAKTEAKGESDMALSEVERVLWLKSTPLFSGLRSEDLRLLARGATELYLEDGAALIQQGERQDCLFLIVSGEVEVLKNGVRVVTRHAREVVGELAALTGQARTAACRAAGPVTALVIDRDAFTEALLENPELALGIIHSLALKLDEATRDLSEARA